MKISFGIAAYNEENNIGKQLRAIQMQDYPPNVELSEIIVVASGCTDNTVDIVRKFQKKNEHIKLVIEEERSGIYSAHNKIFKCARGDIVVLVNADVLLKKDAIRHLIFPFKETSVVATYGRAIPINDSKGFWGYVCHFYFKLNYPPQFHRFDIEGSGGEMTRPCGIITVYVA